MRHFKSPIVWPPQCHILPPTRLKPRGSLFRKEPLPDRICEIRSHSSPLNFPYPFSSPKALPQEPGVRQSTARLADTTPLKNLAQNKISPALKRLLAQQILPRPRCSTCVPPTRVLRGAPPSFSFASTGQRVPEDSQDKKGKRSWQTH